MNNVVFEKSVNVDWLVENGFLFKKEYFDGNGVYCFVRDMESGEVEDWKKVSDGNEFSVKYDVEMMGEEGVEMYCGDREVVVYGEDDDYECVVMDCYLWVEG